MIHQNRWILLKHVEVPDDLGGMHFDLLIEDEQNCRTWRLNDIPVLDGVSVNASLLPAHRLQWLEVKNSCQVSGGRGWVYRVDGGIFCGSLPKSTSSNVFVRLIGSGIIAYLEINGTVCRFISREDKRFV